MIQRFEAFTSAISDIHRDIQKIERAEMERFGLKGAYAQYLLSIYRRPEGMTAAALSRLCGKNKAAVSRILGEMEQAELIHRGSSSYRALLTLTPRGQEAAQYISQRCCAATAFAGEGLTDEARSILYAALQHIENNLQKLSLLGLPCSKHTTSEGEIK